MIKEKFDRELSRTFAGLMAELRQVADEHGKPGADLIALLDEAGRTHDADVMHHALAFRQSARAPLTNEQVTYLLARLRAESERATAIAASDPDECAHWEGDSGH
jgi:hypothetical protein